jgi:hypothetical protein
MVVVIEIQRRRTSIFLMPMTKSQRLNALLDHLSVDEFREAPFGVGLKTALEARDRELIEIVFVFEGRTAAFFRLTKAGMAFRYH